MFVHIKIHSYICLVDFSRMTNILQYLTTDSILDILELCPPRSFVRFISCNKSIYLLGKHMIEKKVVESLKKKTEIDQTTKTTSFVLPNGNLHGKQCVYHLKTNELIQLTTWKNGKLHGLKKGCYFEVGGKKILQWVEVHNEEKGLVFSYKQCMHKIYGCPYKVRSFMVKIGLKMVKFRYMVCDFGRKRDTFVYMLQYNLPHKDMTYVTRRILNRERLPWPEIMIGRPEPADRHISIINDKIHMTIQITDVNEQTAWKMFQRKVNQVMLAKREHLDKENMIFVGFWDFVKGERWKHLTLTDGWYWWNFKWWSFKGANWFIVFVHESKLICIRFRTPPVGKSPEHSLWTPKERGDNFCVL